MPSPLTCVSTSTGEPADEGGCGWATQVMVMRGVTPRLGEFLRARRALVRPEDHGMPSGTRGRELALSTDFTSA